MTFRGHANPPRPRRISGNDTVPCPRSFLSTIPASRSRTTETGCVKSRFHSMAFMARSRWASKIHIGGGYCCSETKSLTFNAGSPEMALRSIPIMKRILHSIAKTIAVAAIAMFSLATWNGCSEKEITDTVPDPEEEPGPSNSDLPEPSPKQKKN